MLSTDEPRRSGRATKGQHKNLEPAEVSTPKNKKGTATASTKKSSKKSAEPEPEPEAEDEEEGTGDVIRCVCGDVEDNVVGRAFISCDTCEVWQHNVCMGVPLEEEKQPEHYFCEQCSPEDHKELLDAMSRGEELWEVRKQAHEEEKRRKRNEKKRPKNRKSGAARQSAVSDVKSEAPASEASPAPAAPSASASASASAPAPSQDSAPSAGNKRKFEEETPQQEQGQAAPVQDIRRSSSAATQSKRRKSEQKKEEKVDADTALVEIEQLPKERQNVAAALAKVFADVVRERVTTG